jgi:hypothetical protein
MFTLRLTVFVFELFVVFACCVILHINTSLASPPSVKSLKQVATAHTAVSLLANSRATIGAFAVIASALRIRN